LLTTALPLNCGNLSLIFNIISPNYLFNFLFLNNHFKIF
jgi:hypothetical protein